MAKKQIIFLLLSVISFSTILNAQVDYKVIYKVKHDWVKKMKHVDYMSDAAKAKNEYMWGARAQYESEAVLYFNENCSRYEEVSDQSEWASQGYSYREDEYYIFRDLKQNRSYDVMRVLNKLYLVDDTLAVRNWKILNDIREIAGHICMSARFDDELKGNTVIAWFALDLPYEIGPERYGGLPGMILEININDGAKVLTADTIVELEDYSIEKPIHKKRVKIITEAEFQAVEEKHINQKKKAEQPYFYGLRY